MTTGVSEAGVVDGDGTRIVEEGEVGAVVLEERKEATV